MVLMSNQPLFFFWLIIMVMQHTLTPLPNLPSAELFPAICVSFKLSMESRLVEERSCSTVVITAVRCVWAWGLLWFYYKHKTADVWWHNWNFNLQPGDLLYLHIQTLINPSTVLPQLIAANPHFHKHLKDLRKKLSLSQEQPAIRGELLPHECHVGRLATCFTHEKQAEWASPAYIHTHTRTHWHSSCLFPWFCVPRTHESLNFSFL